MVADAYNHRLVAVQDAVQQQQQQREQQREQQQQQQQQQQRELISPPTLSSRSSLAAKRGALKQTPLAAFPWSRALRPVGSTHTTLRWRRVATCL